MKKNIVLFIAMLACASSFAQWTGTATKTAVTVDANGNVVAPASFVSKYDDVVNDLGQIRFVGLDGTVSNCATIAIAKSAAMAAGGGAIYLPAGQFTIGSGWTAPTNTTIRGVGRGTGFTTNFPPNSTVLIGDMNMAKNAVIEDLIIYNYDGRTGGGNTPALHSSAAANYPMYFTARRVSCFVNSATIQHTIESRGTGNYFEDVWAWQFPTKGYFSIKNVRDNRYVNCVASNMTGFLIKAEDYTNHCDNVILDNCVAMGCYKGVHVYTAGSYVSNLVVRAVADHCTAGLSFDIGGGSSGSLYNSSFDVNCIEVQNEAFENTLSTTNNFVRLYGTAGSKVGGWTGKNENLVMDIDLYLSDEGDHMQYSGIANRDGMLPWNVCDSGYEYISAGLESADVRTIVASGGKLYLVAASTATGGNNLNLTYILTNDVMYVSGGTAAGFYRVLSTGTSGLLNDPVTGALVGDEYVVCDTSLGDGTYTAGDIQHGKVMRKFSSNDDGFMLKGDIYSRSSVSDAFVHTEYSQVGRLTATPTKGIAQNTVVDDNVSRVYLQGQLWAVNPWLYFGVFGEIYTGDTTYMVIGYAIDMKSVFEDVNGLHSVPVSKWIP